MQPLAPLKVARPPDRPVLLFDGQCGFCRRWAGRWRSITGPAIDYEPSQVKGKEFPEISQAALDKAVHLIEVDGTVRSGGAAALRAFDLAGKHRSAWWLYRHLALFATIVEILYGFVERHRGGILDTLDRWLLGSRPTWPAWRIGRWAFLRCLGLIYLIAFLDFWRQCDGLVGSRGILPIAELLNAVRAALHRPEWHYLPTLCWLNSSDGFLHAICLSGCIAAVLLMANILPKGAAIIAWALYLSLVTAGQGFFSFQWDALLLEAGFLAIFYTPIEPWPRLGHGSEPSAIVRWLLRWLLFRLMFLSGLVKLISHDPTWLNFTALNYHYWTQPLPPWTAWYMAQTPQWFEQISVGFVYFAELLCPVLILGPRRVRWIGLLGIALLQILILATGNYGFFNLLALALCLPLIEDDSRFWGWTRRLRRKQSAADPDARANRVDPPIFAWRGWILAPVAAFLVFLTIMAARRDTFGESLPAKRVQRFADYFQPFQIANSYGLFRVMTTDRPVIVITGSDDGEHWKEYAFKYQTGDVGRRPAFCVPIMPRLDWRMWFLALDAENAGPNGWDGTILELLMRRLKAGSPEVLGLLAGNPFPAHPPRYVMAELYLYRFTTAAERRQTGDWWTRRDTGELIERLPHGYDDAP